MRSKVSTLSLMVLFLAPMAWASTWYTDGANGRDDNDCKSAQTACKTIGHAISLASSGDSIRVAAATYVENVNNRKALKILGSGANATFLSASNPDLPVVRVITPLVQVTTNALLSKLTISGGKNSGIFNSGTLTMNDCIVTHNSAQRHYGISFGGGIFNIGTLTINNSTISANGASGGGGIYSRGMATINSSTLSGNSGALGAGIFSQFGAPLAITNSTISGNIGDVGAGITGGTTVISNSTISGNSASNGGGIANAGVTLRNSIVANNNGGNCYNNVLTSKGYNLSSDGSCTFNGPGDLNDIDPRLGALGYHGGPTKTMALPSGSPAVDAGDPSGCRDNHGNLLKTDQRGFPRHDQEDIRGCDMGAYERQSD